MNNLRRAAEAGASIYRVKSRDPKTGEPIDQRVNPVRQAKKATGLSGRQLKKLRKHLNRQHRARAVATVTASTRPVPPRT